MAHHTLKDCFKSVLFNLHVPRVLKSLGKYPQNNPAQISHLAEEEIEGLSNFLKVTQPVIHGKLGTEAKVSTVPLYSLFCVVWLLSFSFKSCWTYTHISRN